MFMNTSGERLKNLLEERRIAKNFFAEQMKTAPQNVNNWFNRGVPSSFAVEICRQLSINYDWLMHGIGEQSAGAGSELAPARPRITPIELWDDKTPLDSDEIEVPFLKEVELSAGNGRSEIIENHGSKLRFGAKSLRKQGVDPSNAVCVTVYGNSMEPLLKNGATVGVDRGRTDIIDGDIYALAHAGSLRVKQLYRLPMGGVRIRSLNREEYDDEEYSIEKIRENEISVIGRVFWSAMYL